jgi:hypothetical protein
MTPTAAQRLSALVRPTTRHLRALVIGALVIAVAGVPGSALAAPGPSPDPAPHVGPDPADAGATPAPRPAASQPAPAAPRQTAPVQQAAPVAAAAATAPRARSARRPKARPAAARRSRPSRPRHAAQVGSERLGAPVVVPRALSVLRPGPLLLRGPLARTTAGDLDAPALLFASLALLLLVGASAAFLHTTMLGGGNPLRVRSA